MPHEPWHRVPTAYAGWLNKRHGQGGEGRFRLAGFSLDLDRVFPAAGPDPRAHISPTASNGTVSLGLAKTGGPWQKARLPSPDQPPLVSVAYPLSGDRFLLLGGAETLRLTLKADCHIPFPDGHLVHGRPGAGAHRPAL